jgi:hypothetical protein
MTENAQDLQIRLRLKGGSGPNSNWLWEILDAGGAVVKSGTITGPEHKAFATARQAKDKLAKPSGK